MTFSVTKKTFDLCHWRQHYGSQSLTFCTIFFYILPRGRNCCEKDDKLIFNADVENSLKLFKLDRDFNENDLKKIYKQLVKKYHPDVINSIKDKENMIKKINNAYKLLFNILKNNKCK